MNKSPNCKKLRIVLHAAAFVWGISIFNAIMPWETVSLLIFGKGNVPDYSIVRYLVVTRSIVFMFVGVLFLISAINPLKHVSTTIYLGLVELVFGIMIFAFGMHLELELIALVANAGFHFSVGIGILLLLYLTNNERRMLDDQVFEKLIEGDAEDCRDMVSVEDYSDYEKKYLINMAAGKWSVATHKFAAKISGYASTDIEIGFFKTKRVFIAIFAHKDALILLIDGKRINLLSQGCVVKRRQIPLTWTYYFTVTQNDEVLIGFWYSFVTFETWPNDGDILTYVANVAGDSYPSMLRSFSIWSAGHDIPISQPDEDVDKKIREEPS